MSKRIRLTGSDLKQIVEESVNMTLNEAYGTASEKDYNDYDNFNPENNVYGRNYQNGNIDVGQTSWFIHVNKSLHNAYQYAVMGAGRQRWGKDIPFEQKNIIQKYYSKVVDNITKAMELMDRVGKIYRMKTGEQPEPGYAHEYDKPSYGGYSFDKGERHDYSGPSTYDY